MRNRFVRVCILAPSLLLLSLLGSASARAQSFQNILSDIEPLITTSGSFSIVPIDTWGSGDFEAFTDSLFGYSTPRVSQMYVSMDQTASTTYEGDLFFRKLRLKVGLDVDVDNNFVGKLNRLMGYIDYEGFTLRVQNSTLRGTAVWTGTKVPGMPSQTSFDNSYTSVDLLYYTKNGGLDYFGIGYTSYQLPVQLDCLVYNAARGSVWWAPTSTVYQPDMAFHIYSLLLGLDTLHQAFVRTGYLSGEQGFGIWMATQDRAGGGLSYISDQAKAWVQQANNNLTLWSAEQIAMLVDYDLILDSSRSEISALRASDSASVSSWADR